MAGRSGSTRRSNGVLSTRVEFLELSISSVCCLPAVDPYQWTSEAIAAAFTTTPTAIAHVNHVAGR